jgi:hypothetical protein
MTRYRRFTFIQKTSPTYDTVHRYVQKPKTNFEHRSIISIYERLKKLVYYYANVFNLSMSPLSRVLSISPKTDLLYRTAVPK